MFLSYFHFFYKFLLQNRRIRSIFLYVFLYPCAFMCDRAGKSVHGATHKIRLSANISIVREPFLSISLHQILHAHSVHVVKVLVLPYHAPYKGVCTAAAS